MDVFVSNPSLGLDVDLPNSKYIGRNLAEFDTLKIYLHKERISPRVKA